MYGIGIAELLIILLLALLVFGAGKLPEIGRGLGRAIKEFKAASKELSRQTSTVEAKSEAKRTEARKEPS